MDKDSVAIRGDLDIYVINKDGTIETMPRLNNKFEKKEGRVLTKTNNSSGYPRVTLTINGTTKAYFVHRLVALAFIPNPEHKRFVNHKDGNRENSNVDNLEWVTKSENEKYKYSSGQVDPCVHSKPGEDHPMHKLTWDDVNYIRNNYVKGSIYTGQCALARMFNITQANVYDIVHYKSWIPQNNEKEIL